MNKLLESKKFNKIHIDNSNPIQSLTIAPFINEGGSIFKKDAIFLESIIIGNSKKEIPGTLSFKNNEFLLFSICLMIIIS